MNRQERKEFLSLCEEFGNRCVRCGLEKKHLDRDRIFPGRRGGTYVKENIQPLCAWCNVSKRSETFNWKNFRRKHGWDIKVFLRIPESHPFNGIGVIRKKRLPKTDGILG